MNHPADDPLVTAIVAATADHHVSTPVVAIVGDQTFTLTSWVWTEARCEHEQPALTTKWAPAQFIPTPDAVRP